VGLEACRSCGLVQEAGGVPAGSAAYCARCGSEMIARKKNSVSRTLAFSSAALALYVPSMVLPVASFDYLGEHENVTIWDGIHGLYEDGSWAIAALVFATSMLSPFLKIAALFLLGLTARRAGWEKARLRLFRLVELANPWNMLEVFLLAYVIGVVKFGEKTQVYPEAGSLAFAGVVALLVLASESFDARLIWDPPEAAS
jgi:paraquat-inducible protein A